MKSQSKVQHYLLTKIRRYFNHQSKSESLKMTMPSVFSAKELNEYSCQEEYEMGLWRPARPFSLFNSNSILLKLKIRFLLAFKVFIGRYDAVDWCGK